MEIELTRTQLASFDAVLDTTMLHEETMEMIVPDACPDILRIADTAGTVSLKSKETTDGRVEVAGTARCAVLYLPDGETGMRRLEMNIPFFCTADAPGIRENCAVVAVPRLLAADTRAINPRKVLVRVNLAIDIKVFAAADTSLCGGAECDDESGVEQLKECHKAYVITCVQEKPFTFCDDLTISGSRPEAAELLKSRVNLSCTESKIIGNKLIFKGTADLRLCYRATDESICTADFELPFSQIMEVGGVEEEADCTLELCLTDLGCTLGAGDGRMVAVSMGVLAQAVVREERSMELLTDIYSTRCDVKAELQPYTLNHLVERNVRRQSGREVLETGVGVRLAIDAAVSVGSVTLSREGGRGGFSAEVRLSVLYLTEENEVYTIQRQVNVPCQVELPEECICSCTCSCPGEVFATPTTGGIEVRFDLDFRYQTLGTTRVVAVCGAQAGELSGKREGGEPSIVLRVVENERLWDVAKSYRTTMADILQANELESGGDLAGKLLLIPRKR